MARMSKRISNKINKAKQEQQPKETKKKYGKDIWLILLIIVNFFLLITGWQTLLQAPASFATYLLLEVVLVIMYVNRHVELSENVGKWLFRVQVFFMAIILILFAYNAITYFMN